MVQRRGGVPGRRRGPGRPAGGQPGEGREALLKAAQDLMAEKGLPRVTVREVADRAGVQPALVNYYFGGKEGLLRAVVAHVASRTLERATRALAQEGTAEERLRAMLRAVILGMTEDPYGPRLIAEQVLFGRDEVIDDFAERFAQRNLALIQDLVETGRKEGAFRELDPLFLVPGVLGGAIFFFLSAPVLQRLFGIREIDADLAERFADHYVEVVLRGITTPAKESS
ncbi:MAG: TetR family transcriptional regulator [Myxococcota bacterium]|nr:TetR family transcriptional regulator [Myxococcota bacterium]